VKTLNSERNVVVASVDARNVVNSVGNNVDQGIVEWKAMEFRQELYGNFQVEYALGRNIVIHFFVHPDALCMWKERQLESWWQGVFPLVLSDVAQQHFGATTPRIMAKYTMETASWWFKAQGYDYLLDQVAFLHAFFERLDGSLPSVDGQPPAHAAATASS
jgi:hypothetical protein